MYTLNLEATNNADETFIISATDENDAPFDFSTASEIAVVVKNERDCEKLRATLDNGKVTLPEPDKIQVAFSAAEMRSLCPAQYKIGGVANMGGDIVSIFVGSFNVIDGVARL